MFDDVDAEKREQERLLRTMNKVGTRPKSASFAPQPNRASWNVNLAPGVRANHGTGGSMKKSDQAEAIKLLREQLLQEEGGASPRLGNPEPSPRDSSSTIPRSDSIEDQAELSAASAFNENREMARINRWTRGGGGGGGGGGSVKPVVKEGGGYEKPIPAVLMRAGAIEDSLKEEATQAPSMKENEEYTQGVSKFTHSVIIASKALRQQNGEALTKAVYAVVTIAKNQASLAKDDEQILSWAKALEGTNNMLRGRVDSGSNGQEFFNEISNSLGQLYLNVVSLS